MKGPKFILAILLATLIVSVADLASSQTQNSQPSVPPGYTMARTGGMHDFDYFQGDGPRDNDG
jgi:hypothetical protein